MMHERGVVVEKMKMGERERENGRERGQQGVIPKCPVKFSLGVWHE
jgi:hypothetical protein